MSSNSMAPTSPNPDDVQRAINIFLILSVIASFPIAILIVHIIRTCYRELAKRLLPPQDTETGRYLPQAMQGQPRPMIPAGTVAQAMQGQPRPMMPAGMIAQAMQGRAPPMIWLGTVVIYKNIKQETKEAANCSNECAICLEEFKERDRCRILSKCKHLYHMCCIDRWLLKNLHCPLCRCSIATHGPTAA